MRTAIVTGGGTGIGRATANELAQGSTRVVLGGRRIDVLELAADAIRAHVGPRAAVFAHRLDITDVESIESFKQWFIDHVSVRCDILINNAGVRNDKPAPTDLFALMTYAESIYRTNVVGQFLMTEAILPLMGSGGRIVYVSSVAAHRGGKEMYSASKAALIGLGRSQAKELGARGVSVNVVAPGFVPGTGMFLGRLSEDRLNAERAASPLGRLGSPEDVARAIGYLTDPSTSYVTGEVLNINGGAWFSG